MSNAPTPSAERGPSPRPTRRRRRSLVALGAVVLLAAAAALAVPGLRRAIADPGGRPAVADVTRVEVGNHAWEAAAFSPSAIEVPVGTEVTWEFTDAEEHNVVFDDLASPTQASGTGSRAFDQPGSYRYACTLHSGMDGRVDVVAAP